MEPRAGLYEEANKKFLIMEGIEPWPCSPWSAVQDKALNSLCKFFFPCLVCMPFNLKKNSFMLFPQVCVLQLYKMGQKKCCTLIFMKLSKSFVSDV